MRCVHCGEELANRDQECPRCGRMPDGVTVLTAEERENFQGVTLESGPSDGRRRTYESDRPGQRIYVRQMTFGSGGLSLWTKLMIVALLGFLIFVFLPLAIFVAVSISLIWLLFRLLRR